MKGGDYKSRKTDQSPPFICVDGLIVCVCLSLLGYPVPAPKGVHNGIPGPGTEGGAQRDTRSRHRRGCATALCQTPLEGRPCHAPRPCSLGSRWNFPRPPAKAYSVTVAAYAFRWRVAPSTWKGPNALDAAAMRGKTFRWAKMHPACKRSAARIKHPHLQVASENSTCMRD